MNLDKISKEIKSHIVLNQDVIDYCINSLEDMSYINYNNLNEYQLEVLITNLFAFYDAKRETNIILDKGKCLEIQAEKFMEIYLSSPKTCLKKYSELDLIILSEVQYLKGAENTQNCFFQILKNMINNQKRIIILADKNPDELSLDKDLIEIFSKMKLIDLRKS